MKKNIRICFLSSSGGHFEQLMMLSPLMDKYESFIVTEKVKYDINTKRKKYLLRQVNRKEFDWLLKLFINTLISIKIFIIEKPTHIITTGALTVIPFCILGRLFKKKVIFIESFAKVNSPTLTGKLLYKFADQFYVQWEQMLKIYPNAIYKGGIY